jgi:hypothetical protein
MLKPPAVDAAAADGHSAAAAFAASEQTVCCFHISDAVTAVSIIHDAV